MSHGPNVADGLAQVIRGKRATVLNLPRLEQQQSPYIFEGTAFEIWRRIDGTRTERHIVEELARLTRGDVATIAEDTHSFISSLLELGLAEHAD